MNHHNGKSFFKLQYFLCYCFALNFSEKQLLYSFSLLLLLVILMLIFPSMFDLILKRLLELKIKLNWLTALPSSTPTFLILDSHSGS